MRNSTRRRLNRFFASMTLLPMVRHHVRAVLWVLARACMQATDLRGPLERARERNWRGGTLGAGNSCATIEGLLRGAGVRGTGSVLPANPLAKVIDKYQGLCVGVRAMSLNPAGVDLLMDEPTLAPDKTRSLGDADRNTIFFLEGHNTLS